MRLTGWTTRAAILALLTASTAAPARQQDQPPPPEKCCFTNPGYTGVCEIQPAKEAYPVIEDALMRYSRQRRKGFSK